jgi:TolB protein
MLYFNRHGFRWLHILRNVVFPLSLLSGPLTFSAYGELRITLDRAQFQPLPIAISIFHGDSFPDQGISGVIGNDLRLSGYFMTMATPRDATPFDQTPHFEPWKIHNIQALVTGQIDTDPTGGVSVSFRLWDVTTGEQLAGERYTTSQANWRRMGHMISDVIFQKLTGLSGFFNSRIAFVDETESRRQRKKRLAIMDIDGANIRYLTKGEKSVVTPRFSLNNPTELAYVTQQLGSPPFIVRVNVDDHVASTLPVPGSTMVFSPTFYPNGSKLTFSLQKGGNAELYTQDFSSQELIQMTSSNAINTSPSYSPDGRMMVFESDRGGSQQIYIMPSDRSTEPQRLSFGGGSYSQPVWSPRGDYIAFTRRQGGQFAIGIMKPDGSGLRILSEGFHNERPSWAPNGQFLVFFRDSGGEGGSQLRMVDIMGRVDVALPTPNSASDPAWSPLRSGS